MNKREAIYNVITEAQDKYFNHVNWNCATFVGKCVEAYSGKDFITNLLDKNYLMGNWHNDFRSVYKSFLNVAKDNFIKVDNPQTGDVVFIRTAQDRVAFAIWYDGFAFTLHTNQGTITQKNIINAWRLK